MRRSSLLIVSLFCFLLTFLLAASAFAQAAVSTPASTTGGLFLQTMLEPLLGALAIVIAAAGAFFTAWLRNKSADASTSAAAKVATNLSAKASEIMLAAVHATFATMNPKIKAAAEDGTLTSEEGAALRKATLDAFLASLGEAFKSQLMGGLGLSEVGLKTTYATGLLEQTLNSVKVEKAKELAIRADAEAVVARSSAAVATSGKTEADLLKGMGVAVPAVK